MPSGEKPLFSRVDRIPRTSMRTLEGKSWTRAAESWRNVISFWLKFCQGRRDPPYWPLCWSGPPDGDRGIYKTRPTIIVCPATYPRPNVVRRCGNLGPFITRTARKTQKYGGKTISLVGQFEKYCDWRKYCLRVYEFFEGNVLCIWKYACDFSWAFLIVLYNSFIIQKKNNKVLFIRIVKIYLIFA